MAAPLSFLEQFHGYVQRQVSASWAITHNAFLGTSVSTAATVIANASSSRGFVLIRRAFLTFDLSKLPIAGAGIAIVWAKLQIFVTSVTNDDNGSFNVVGETTPDSDDALIIEDYHRCAPTHGATKFLDVDVDLGTLAVLANKLMTFNAAGRSAVLGAMGGNFTPGIRIVNDIGDAEPSGTNSVSFTGGTLTVNLKYSTVI